MDLEVGREVAGKVHAVAAAPAAAGQKKQIDVGIAEQNIEPAAEIEMIGLAEVVVDIPVHRQHQGCQGNGLQGAGQAPDHLGRGHDEAFAVQFRVIRVLGPVDKGDRIPGIAGAPAQVLLARFQHQARRGLEGKVAVVEDGLDGFAKIGIAVVRVDPGKEPADSFFQACLELQAAVVFRRGAPLVAIEKPEVVQGRIGVEAEQHRAQLRVAAYMVRLPGKLGDLEAEFICRGSGGKSREQENSREQPARPPRSFRHLSHSMSHGSCRAADHSLFRQRSDSRLGMKVWVNTSSGRVLSLMPAKIMIER